MSTPSCPFTATRFNEQDHYVVFGACKEEQCAIYIKPGKMYKNNGDTCEEGMCAIKATALKNSNSMIQI